MKGKYADDIDMLIDVYRRLDRDHPTLKKIEVIVVTKANDCEFTIIAKGCKGD